MSKHDVVNHPAHYTTGKVEVIEYIEDKLTLDQLEGYFVGNVIKYVSRYKHKGGVEDLKKAAWYLNRMIGKLGATDTNIGSKEAGQAPEVRKCDYTSKECANKRCEFDLAYKAECRDNYFCHHRGEKMERSCETCADNCEAYQNYKKNCIDCGYRHWLPQEGK